jgi:hypothetical protein
MRSPCFRTASSWLRQPSRKTLSLCQRAPLCSRGGGASRRSADPAELETAEGLRDRRPPGCSEPTPGPRVAHHRQLRRQSRSWSALARTAAHGGVCLHVLCRAAARRSDRVAATKLPSSRRRLGIAHAGESRPPRSTGAGPTLRPPTKNAGSKHRPAQETRRVPIPPELVQILRVYRQLRRRSRRPDLQQCA